MKHEEQEMRVQEIGEPRDGENATGRCSEERQANRRRFLKTSAALAAGSAAAYSVPSVTMAGSGVGLSPAAPVRGQHFQAIVPNPQNLAQYIISILDTPIPYAAERSESTANVATTTGGTFVLRYTGIDDQPYEVTKEVEVDNVTRVLLVDGMPANNLADVFNADLSVAPKNVPAVLEIDWELVVLILIVLLFLILLGTTYKTDAGKVVETLDDGWPCDPDETQAAGNAWVAGLGLNPAPNKKAPPADSYDCHGWTFTKGVRWINNDQVQDILTDNGYMKRAPGTVQANDVVVYRIGDPPKITHSGIVTITADGVAIEIESKWGAYGRFNHTPAVVPNGYGTPNYYHSARIGHNLAES